MRKLQIKHKYTCKQSKETMITPEVNSRHCELTCLVNLKPIWKLTTYTCQQPQRSRIKI